MFSPTSENYRRFSVLRVLAKLSANPSNDSPRPLCFNLKMTSFARYYKNKKLIEVSMSKIRVLITDKSNKDEIAQHVYERLYTRFLKIFDFTPDKEIVYEKNGKMVKRNSFNEEYKNGFIQLAACSLMIETFAAFLTGENETPRGKSPDRFKKVFEYADSKSNDLKVFKSNKHFYERIRCGILHQGETKGKYTITRSGQNLLKDEKIDAYLFHKSLKDLLMSYKNDLETKNWDNEMWDACRQKIRHIINNEK